VSFAMPGTEQTRQIRYETLAYAESVEHELAAKQRLSQLRRGRPRNVGASQYGRDLRITCRAVQIATNRSLAAYQRLLEQFDLG